MAADGLLAPLAEEEEDSDLVSESFCSAVLNLHVVVQCRHNSISIFQNTRINTPQLPGEG